MPDRIIEENCRNCGEVLFQKRLFEDGHTEMLDSSLWPESDGEIKYFRCPSCRGKNLVTVDQEPGKPRVYEIVGFIRK